MKSHGAAEPACIRRSALAAARASRLLGLCIASLTPPPPPPPPPLSAPPQLRPRCAAPRAGMAPAAATPSPAPPSQTGPLPPPPPMLPMANGGTAAAMLPASAGTKTTGLPNKPKSLSMCCIRSLRSFSRCFCPNVSILKGKLFWAFSTSALRCFSTSSADTLSSSPTFRWPGGGCGDTGLAARLFSSAISSCRFLRYAGTLPTSFLSTGGAASPTRARFSELARAFAAGRRPGAAPPAPSATSADLPPAEAVGDSARSARPRGGSLGARRACSGPLLGRGFRPSLAFRGGPRPLPPLPGAPPGSALGRGGLAPGAAFATGLASPLGVAAPHSVTRGVATRDPGVSGAADDRCSSTLRSMSNTFAGTLALAIMISRTFGICRPS
mmetsp:Transcript_62793/g.162932  ORF Transcript_62793/g.162932 Transcript_62793/m.162932 type:complete len:384 (+) Transcript_62793:158-1309(+)